MRQLEPSLWLGECASTGYVYMYIYIYTYYIHVLGGNMPMLVLSTASTEFHTVYIVFFPVPRLTLPGSAFGKFALTAAETGCTDTSHPMDPGPAESMRHSTQSH
jgi:hypothetical protein